jgi:hypothetical protein
LLRRNTSDDSQLPDRTAPDITQKKKKTTEFDHQEKWVNIALKLATINAALLQSPLKTKFEET